MEKTDAIVQAWTRQLALIVALVGGVHVAALVFMADLYGDMARTPLLIGAAASFAIAGLVLRAGPRFARVRRLAEKGDERPLVVLMTLVMLYALALLIVPIFQHVLLSTGEPTSEVVLHAAWAAAALVLLFIVLPALARRLRP